jgi:hypothetical protein
METDERNARAILLVIDPILLALIRYIGVAAHNRVVACLRNHLESSIGELGV